MMRHWQRWTAAEIDLVRERFVSWGIERLAEHLYRRPSAILRMMRNRGIKVAELGWVDTAAASAISGFSERQLQNLARRGLVIAKRQPGQRVGLGHVVVGTKWMFDPVTLPCRGEMKRQWKREAA